VALSGPDCRSSRGVCLGRAGVLPLEFLARLTVPLFAIVGTDDAVKQLEVRDHRLHYPRPVKQLACSRFCGVRFMCGVRLSMYFSKKKKIVNVLFNGVGIIDLAWINLPVHLRDFSFGNSLKSLSMYV
jgi:hypothetical protein